MIEGNFKDVSLPGLLQFLAAEVSKNYRVRVSTAAGGAATAGGQTGDIYVSRGFVVCASFGLLEGEDAICEFLSWREGTFFVETLTANVEVKKNLKRAVSPSNAFVENTLYINENNVGLNTVIVASKTFGSVEWQESLRQQPLEREDFVVLGWVGEGRTMRQALREFSFDIAQATGILTRLIKTKSVQVLRPSAQDVTETPPGTPGADPVGQRFVTTGGQEAAAATVAQAAARAYAQEATAAVAHDAFISTSFKPGSIPVNPPGKNDKGHGNPLLDPIKKIGLDLAQVRASMEARLRSRISRKMPDEAHSQSGSHPAPRANSPNESGSHAAARSNPLNESGAHQLPQSGSHPAQLQSGAFPAPSTTQSGGHYMSTASSGTNYPPVPPANAGSFGPVGGNTLPANSTSSSGMRLPPPDYVSGQWMGARPTASPNVVSPGTGSKSADQSKSESIAEPGHDSIIGEAPSEWHSPSSASAFTVGRSADMIGSTDAKAPPSAVPHPGLSSVEAAPPSVQGPPISSSTATDAQAGPLNSAQPANAQAASLNSAQPADAPPLPHNPAQSPKSSVNAQAVPLNPSQSVNAQAVPLNPPQSVNAQAVPLNPPQSVNAQAVPLNPPQSVNAQAVPLNPPQSVNAQAVPLNPPQSVNAQAVPLNPPQSVNAQAVPLNPPQSVNAQAVPLNPPQSVNAQAVPLNPPQSVNAQAVPLNPPQSVNAQAVPLNPPQSVNAQAVPLNPPQSASAQAIPLNPPQSASASPVAANPATAQNADTALESQTNAANAKPPGSSTRERTEALPMVTIDIDRLLQATFTPTQFGKLALTNPALDQLRRQTLLDVEAGKTLAAVIAEGTRPAAAILNSYRYCLDRGYIDNSDPVVSMTTELLLGRMELDQYLLQRRRLTGDQLRDLVDIARKEGVKLTQVLVRSGYLTVGDLDTLEREQKRFAFK